MANDEHVAALRKRLLELEHDMYINDAIMAASPKNATPGDVEVARWRRAEAAALHAAIELLEGRRSIPAWLYLMLSVMVVLALALAGMALWIG